MRWLIAILLLAACSGPGHVHYADGQCLIDGQPATRAQVEAREAEVSQRMLARQPLQTLLTVLVIVLIGASNLGKLRAILSSKSSGGLAERVKAALDRSRAHPVRYVSIVIGGLVVLLVAGGCYIYLDVDRRASERALGMLQFCHLALRTQEEQSVLEEQRKNLSAIQSTAGDIRSLVNKLPPEEQRKAQEIVDQMGKALGREGSLVNQYLQHTDESTKALKENTELLQRGLSSVEAGVLGLKSLPGDLHDLTSEVKKVDGHVGALDGRLGGLDGRFGALDGKLGALDGKLGALDGRFGALDGKVNALDGKLARLQQLDAEVKSLAARVDKPADGKRPVDKPADKPVVRHNADGGAPTALR